MNRPAAVAPPLHHRGGHDAGHGADERRVNQGSCPWEARQPLVPGAVAARPRSELAVQFLNDPKQPLGIENRRGLGKRTERGSFTS